jgi:homocysteine S-methyltransferase
MSLLETSPCVLTEGALIERIRRDGRVPLDPHILHAAFPRSEEGRRALTRLYRQYLDVAREYETPIILGTPTWRASGARLQEAGFGPNDDLNGGAVRFLAELRATSGDFAPQILIGGLMACAGDAYRPEAGLSAGEAESYHRFQAHRLADAGVDFLHAATLPALHEAIGIARAMAATGAPYLLSFVIRPAGTLLDGTVLADAIERIDDASSPAPHAYLVNCVHPSVLHAAIETQGSRADALLRRLVGLQANASARSPEDLDGSEQLDAESPARFAEAMARLRDAFGLRILGCCCGTDDRHVRALAERLVGKHSGGEVTGPSPNDPARARSREA